MKTDREKLLDLEKWIFEKIPSAERGESNFLGKDADYNSSRYYSSKAGDFILFARDDKEVNIFKNRLHIEFEGDNLSDFTIDGFIEDFKAEVALPTEKELEEIFKEQAKEKKELVKSLKRRIKQLENDS